MKNHLSCDSRITLGLSSYCLPAAIALKRSDRPTEFNSESRRKLAVHDIGNDSNAFVAIIDVIPCGIFWSPPGSTLVDEGGLVAFER